MGDAGAGRPRAWPEDTRRLPEASVTGTQSHPLGPATWGAAGTLLRSVPDFTEAGGHGCDAPGVAPPSRDAGGATAQCKGVTGFRNSRRIRAVPCTRAPC